MGLAGTRLKDTERYAGLTLETKAGPVWTGEVRLIEKALLDPIRWTKPRLIFVNSMSDLFHADLPVRIIDMIFAVMALCPQHRFQILTKRSKQMLGYFKHPGVARRVHELACDIVLEGEAPGVVLVADRSTEMHAPPGRRVYLGEWPLKNVWLGVSAEDQKRADERIPDLLATPAAVRFVSAEPLLGPIVLRDAVGRARDVFAEPRVSKSVGLDWIIVGGESGKNARPMDPQWARDIRNQCQSANVPFFFKQWGEWCSVSECEGPGEHHTFDDGRTVRRIGKRGAPKTLDGVVYHEMPEEAP